MITKLTLRNFKSVGEQGCALTGFYLPVVRINSGRNDVPQAVRALTMRD